MKKNLLLILVLFLTTFISAKDSDLYKDVINELSLKKYYGRAYYKNGDAKAAEYISKTFEKVGVKPFDDSYFQEFSFPVNVFHGAMKMSVDGQKLIPAKDFVMREFSSGIKGEYELEYIDSLSFNPEKLFSDIQEGLYSDKILVVDLSLMVNNREAFGSIYRSSIPGVIVRWPESLKFYKAYSSFTMPIAIIWVSPDFPDEAKTVKLNIENEMIENHVTNNVIAYVEGAEFADSFYVFTAHYDHIGMMGKKTMFPGSNDNASGVAMLFSLAEHFNKPENKPKYSMLFLAVAGEETGLRGSTYFVENPKIPLGNIKYVMNFDMIADNSEDIYCEISEEGKAGLDLFNELNQNGQYFTKLELGELAGNSDHYPFAEKDVPAIFFLMEGDGFEIYHTPNDNLETISLENFPKLYNLVLEFIEKY
ncbi:MAG: hypothetical protein C0596_00885 [Marinilabiliales bacterium]|nr:MAG: hypothetical protein C0596_00885 [Marinilabiliales bacterium]